MAFQRLSQSRIQSRGRCDRFKALAEGSQLIHSFGGVKVPMKVLCFDKSKPTNVALRHPNDPPFIVGSTWQNEPSRDSLLPGFQSLCKASLMFLQGDVGLASYVAEFSYVAIQYPRPGWGILTPFPFKRRGEACVCGTSLSLRND